MSTEQMMEDIRALVVQEIRADRDAFVTWLGNAGLDDWFRTVLHATDQKIREKVAAAHFEELLVCENAILDPVDAKALAETITKQLPTCAVNALAGYVQDEAVWMKYRKPQGEENDHEED